MSLNGLDVYWVPEHVKDCTTIQFGDGIIQDTAAGKAQDMAEVGVTKAACEYRMRWYGEDESTARARVAELEENPPR